MKPIRTETDFDDLLHGAKALAVVSAWHDLGLFAALRKGPRPLTELDADERALRTTAPVLRHLGLLVGDEEWVGLSAHATRLMAEGALPTERNFEFLGDLAKLSTVLREGGPVRAEDGREKVTDGGVRQHDPEGTRRFLDMLYRRSEDSAATVLEWVAPLLEAGAAVLDVGGGHGRYARTFADAGFPATVFDLPVVIELTRERHRDALSYLGGDFRDSATDFGGPYGLVLLSNIVHGEPAAMNRGMIGRLAGTLAPGGWLVLKDMFIDAHGGDPENAVFFGLTMLFHTRAGESPTMAEASSWLEGAGLVDVRMTTHERFQLLRARKP